jgi:coniferyl-aldehyde dehydrogenase
MKNDMDHRLALAPLFEAQRSGFAQDPYPNWPARAARLRALDALLLANRSAIADAISADFGHRAAGDTDLADILGSHLAIKHALKHGRRWMRPERRSAGMLLRPARASVLAQPAGVVGIIVPWNYPLFLAVGPLTGALAAGNRAMIKLSELTPRFAELFAKLIAATFAPDEVTVINGDAGVARAFAALPFDRLLFTGSTRVGREVMLAAAANLTPVVLELGGKSPALIGPDARFDDAVEAIVSGKLFNAGQTCVAPDYVLLPRGRSAAFLERARQVTARLYPGLAGNADYSSIISAQHVARLDQLIAEASSRGALVHTLSEGGGDASARRYAPVLVTGAPDDTGLMQEELFGPVLPLVEYDRFEDAVAYINARARPLAMYLFETRQARIDWVLRHSHAGGVTVNDTLLHVACDDLPFGGVGASGIGSYHGIEGFRAFSHTKAVLAQSRLNLRGLVRPPYGKTLATLMRFFLR